MQEGDTREMERSRKAACIIDGPSLRAVRRGEGVANGPGQAGLGGGRCGGGEGVEAALCTCPGSLGGGRWVLGMIPGPEMGCPGRIWPLVPLSSLASPSPVTCGRQGCAGWELTAPLTAGTPGWCFRGCADWRMGRCHQGSEDRDEGKHGGRVGLISGVLLQPSSS